MKSQSIRKEEAAPGMPWLKILFAASLSCFLMFTKVFGATPEDWLALNASVGGRLFSAIPFARPCFPLAHGTAGWLDQQSCSQVIEHYLDRETRIDNFATYMNSEWETCQLTGEQCLLDASNTSDSAAFEPPRACSQGSIPRFYIDVQNISDIGAAFRFSETTGVPLVVKNTGHDYKGRSSGRNALGIWMRNLQTLLYEPEFVPEGCPASKKKPGVTLGAGITHESLYVFADSHNITVPGGADPSVGAAGGYFQGGGHSMLSNALGLSVDRTLQVEVVVPTGEHLIANECQNSDIFFATRGGGGGTFGILISVTTLALPRLSLPTFSFSFTNNSETQRKFMEVTISHSLELARKGWGGYIVPTSGLLLTNPLLNMSAANESLHGLQTSFLELDGSSSFTLQPSWLSFFNTYLVPTDLSIGLPFAVASRLIPRTNFESAENRTQLINTLLPALNNAPLPIIFQVAPLLHGNRGDTSINPVWYDSVWHVTTSAFWNFNSTLNERKQIYRSLSEGMDPIRLITPGSGAYQNEADVYEPNHTESYWGPNYAKLLAIKEKYDPHHLLDCWHCVGSKGVRDRRFECYIPEDQIRS